MRVEALTPFPAHRCTCQAAQNATYKALALETGGEPSHTPCKASGSARELLTVLEGLCLGGGVKAQRLGLLQQTKITRSKVLPCEEVWTGHPRTVARRCELRKGEVFSGKRMGGECT